MHDRHAGFQALDDWQLTTMYPVSYCISIVTEQTGLFPSYSDISMCRWTPQYLQQYMLRCNNAPNNTCCDTIIHAEMQQYTQQYMVRCSNTLNNIGWDATILPTIQAEMQLYPQQYMLRRNNTPNNTEWDSTIHPKIQVEMEQYLPQYRLRCNNTPNNTFLNTIVKNATKTTSRKGEKKTSRQRLNHVTRLAGQQQSTRLSKINTNPSFPQHYLHSPRSHLF